MSAVSRKLFIVMTKNKIRNLKHTNRILIKNFDQINKELCNGGFMLEFAKLLFFFRTVVCGPTCAHLN